MSRRVHIPVGELEPGDVIHTSAFPPYGAATVTLVAENDDGSYHVEHRNYWGKTGEFDAEDNVFVAVVSLARFDEDARQAAAS